MANDAQFPQAGADLVTDSKKPTRWWYDWLRKVNTRIEAAQSTADAAAIAAAEVPEPVYPRIDGLAPIQVVGPDDHRTIMLDPSTSSTGTTIIQWEESHEEPWPLFPPATAAGQASIQFKDEGGNIGSLGAITSVDFVGANVLAAVVGTALTVTVSSGGGGGMTSYGVADSGAAAVTSFAYVASGGSAFSLDTKKLLILRYRLNNVSGVAVNWRFFCNADTTAGNYYSNANLATGGGYSGGNANSARTVDGPSGAEASGLIFVTKDKNGCVHFQVQGRDSTGTGLRTIFTSMYWTNPGVADVTDFIVSCTTATGTGAHAILEVWSP